MHNTPSDRKTLVNEAAYLKRIGLKHPDFKKPERKNEKRPLTDDGYPNYVLGTMTKKTTERFRQLLHERGWPLEVVVRDLYEFGANVNVTRALYLTGYRYHPEGKKLANNARVWVAPPDIVELHEELATRPDREPDVDVRLRVGQIIDRALPTNEENTECTHPSWEELPGFERRCEDCKEILPPLLIRRDQTEEEPERMDEHPEPEAALDFIDERDSWVVDQEQLLGPHLYRMFQDRMSALSAVGIDYEIRVWRKKEA